MNMLTAQEFRRLIAKMGGLWSAADLSRLTGAKVREWASRDGFPDVAWQTGKVKLYSGWEVWHWLLEQEKWAAAEYLKAEMEAMGRRKFAEA